MNKTQKKILIVDDDEMVISLLRSEIEDFGIPCFMAQNSQETMQLVDNHDFALVLTDMHLKQITGKDLINNIQQKNSHYAQIPYIVMSGNTNLVRQEIKHMKNISILEKPINLELLEQLLQEKLHISR